MPWPCELRQRIADRLAEHRATRDEVEVTCVRKLEDDARPAQKRHPDGRMREDIGDLARMRLFEAAQLRAHELRVDARDELASGERLDQIIVRARLQPSTLASSPARAESRMTGTVRVSSCWRRAVIS